MWELPKTRHWGTQSSAIILLGLYIQQSSWKHRGIFLSPVAAEITYSHHPVSQKWSLIVFTLQFISFCFFACLFLTSTRPQNQCDLWFFQPSNSSGDKSPPSNPTSDHQPRQLWHSDRGSGKPEPHAFSLCTSSCFVWFHSYTCWYFCQLNGFLMWAYLNLQSLYNLAVRNRSLTLIVQG